MTNEDSTRSEDASWAALTASRVARLAEQLSPVFAGVDVISSALASLPARIYRRAGGRHTLLTRP